MARETATTEIEPVDTGFSFADEADIPKAGRPGPKIDQALAAALYTQIANSPTKSIKSNVTYGEGDEEYARFKTDSARIKAHLISVANRETASFRVVRVPTDGFPFTYAIVMGSPRKPREAKTNAVASE